MLLFHLVSGNTIIKTHFPLMKRVRLQFTFMVLAITILLISNVSAATVNATSCSQSHVQTAVNSASNGDIVSIPAGSCTWSGSVNWSNKNITLQGAGEGSTVITCSSTGISITADSEASFRITGMTINIPYLSANTVYLQNNTSTVRKGWRIDHVTFNQTGGGQGGASHPIYVVGLLWGVVDNCTFNDGGNGQQSISHYAWVNNVETKDNVGRISWEVVPLGLGTDSAVYIEDCTFNHSTTAMSAINDTQYGGRMVFRHCTIYNSMFMTHSGWGSVRGGLKLEVYDNTFTSNVGNYRPGLIRSGTGVLFNNTFSGDYQVMAVSIDNQRSCYPNPTYCNGGDSVYDGNLENGWPCADQPGRGGGAWKNQPSVPWYEWNNTGATIFELNSCGNPPPDGLSAHVKSTPHSNGEVDFVHNGSTVKPGYAPYTYPHPLRNASAPEPPSDLQIVK
jgi:hypothetical protein